MTEHRHARGAPASRGGQFRAREHQDADAVLGHTLDPVLDVRPGDSVALRFERGAPIEELTVSHWEESEAWAETWGIQVHAVADARALAPEGQNDVGAWTRQHWPELRRWLVGRYALDVDEPDTEGLFEVTFATGLDHAPTGVEAHDCAWERTAAVEFHTAVANGTAGREFAAWLSAGAPAE